MGHLGLEAFAVEALGGAEDRVDEELLRLVGREEDVGGLVEFGLVEGRLGRELDADAGTVELHGTDDLGAVDAGGLDLVVDDGLDLGRGERAADGEVDPRPKVGVGLGELLAVLELGGDEAVGGLGRTDGEGLAHAEGAHDEVEERLWHGDDELAVVALDDRARGVLDEEQLGRERLVGGALRRENADQDRVRDVLERVLVDGARHGAAVKAKSYGFAGLGPVLGREVRERVGVRQGRLRLVHLLVVHLLQTGRDGEGKYIGKERVGSPARCGSGCLESGRRFVVRGLAAVSGFDGRPGFRG